MFGRGGMKDGVRESARVLELGPTAKGAKQTGTRDVEYRFLLELPERRVEHAETMPALKAPLVGDTLPVIVSGRQVRIEWDEVPDVADRARASAAAAATGDAAGAAAALGFTVRHGAS